MRLSRIAGHIFLICFLWITLNAFLFTVLRQGVFIWFPRHLITYSYGMIAPYQSAIAPHGQIHAECMNAAGDWLTVDLAPFYPEIFGERNVREYYASYSYSGTQQDDLVLRQRYASTLWRLLIDRGDDCLKIRFAWDKWPVNEGPFDSLHVSTFTERLPLYGY